MLAFLVSACKKQEPTPAQVEEIYFEQDAPTKLDEGEDINLSSYLVILPEAVADTVTVEWSSSNEEIAIVSMSGLVETLRAGEITITATAMGKTATLNLTIEEIEIDEFTIPETFEVYVGEKAKFPITVKPKGAPLYRFKWEADNNGKKPTYSEGNWYLKADEEREYTLTASVDDALEVTCNVKFVKRVITKVSFTNLNYSIEEGGSLSLKSDFVVEPIAARDTVKITWNSSDTAIATVDSNGKVSALKAGSTTITANASGKTASCFVIVTEKETEEDEETEGGEDEGGEEDIPIIPEVYYTISFNANGGTGNMDNITVKQGESVVLPSNKYENVAHAFTGWSTNISGSGTKYSDMSTITPNSDITLYAQWKYFYTATGTANGHDWVDLGLPSGTKWATTNIGATTIEGYGNYFSWGETETKSIYDNSTYKWYEEGSIDIVKYCTDSYYGNIDNKSVLDLSDDAANANWGGNWRMPTEEEQSELINTNYCSWTNTTLNGVKGFRVTSKINGNSIFLPAAGYYVNSDLKNVAAEGYYWSASLSQSNPHWAYYFSFNSKYGAIYGVDDIYRSYGSTIRAVLK